MSLPGRPPLWLENNKDFVKDFRVPPHIKDVRAQGLENRKATIVLTCLDPRCLPEQFFGPKFDDGSCRNTGGRTTSDAVRSILVLMSLVNIRTVAVVHHTDCGMTHLADEEIINEASERTPEAEDDIAKIDFGCFAEVEAEETTEKDVETMRANRASAGVEVLGFKLDTFMGAVQQVEI